MANCINAGDLQLGSRDVDRFTEDKPDTDLRALFSVHGEPFTVVARRDSEIERLQDLAGKRVNLGNPGSGQRGTMEIVMLAMGWEKATFSLAEELPASQQSLALCQDNGLAPHLEGYAHEALARAAYVDGDEATAMKHINQARRLAGQIEDAEDRALLEADLDELEA